MAGLERGWLRGRPGCAGLPRQEVLQDRGEIEALTGPARCEVSPGRYAARAGRASESAHRDRRAAARRRVEPGCDRGARSGSCRLCRRRPGTHGRAPANGGRNTIRSSYRCRCGRRGASAAGDGRAGDGCGCSPGTGSIDRRGCRARRSARVRRGGGSGRGRAASRGQMPGQAQQLRLQLGERKRLRPGSLRGFGRLRGPGTRGRADGRGRPGRCGRRGRAGRCPPRCRQSRRRPALESDFVRIHVRTVSDRTDKFGGHGGGAFS